MLNKVNGDSLSEATVSPLLRQGLATIITTVTKNMQGKAKGFSNKKLTLSTLSS